jgi:hypothetical protein
VKGLFGRPRLVSLPFADHCVPLVEDEGQVAYLLRSLQQCVTDGEYSEVEVRNIGELGPSGRYGVDNSRRVLHILDLTTDPASLFHALHPDCIQRKIRRAVREGVSCEEGTTESLLQDFYRLLLVTRRRHGLPPQPIEWFRNLIEGLGSDLKIRVAYLGGKAIASIVTLSNKTTLTYKYGASDRKAASIGGMQLLLWKAIEDGYQKQMVRFDMGRSEDNSGLALFKDRWGAARTTLQYLSCPPPIEKKIKQHLMNAGKHVCSQMPNAMLIAAGRFLYRYAG